MDTNPKNELVTAGELYAFCKRKQTNLAKISRAIKDRTGATIKAKAMRAELDRYGHLMNPKSAAVRLYMELIEGGRDAEKI